MNAPPPAALQFGAGSVGRGFLAQLFFESGWNTVFVDTDAQLVENLNSTHSYQLEIVGPQARVLNIAGVSALLPAQHTQITEVIANAVIACTAVGAGALQAIAPVLAEGILLRMQRQMPPLNILICENLPNAHEILHDAVQSHLPEHARSSLGNAAAFVRTAVTRMTPVHTEGMRNLNPSLIRTEAYSMLPVDAEALLQPVPAMQGMQPAAPFEAYAARKLYAHNGAHAALGYLGCLHGFTLGWQALENQALHRTVEEFLEEAGAALCVEYALKPADMQEYTRDLLKRFCNRELADTCARLARDPLRKLAPNDRLTGALMLCRRHGRDTRAIEESIAAAFCCRLPGDEGWEQLQQIIYSQGLAGALQQICKLPAHEAPGIRILQAIQRLQAGGGQ